MFDDFTLEEKMLVCALVNDIMASSKNETTFQVNYFLLQMGKLAPALAQFITLSNTYLHATGLGQDMIANSQLSKYVWENMSIEKRRKVLYALFEYLDLPDVRKNMSQMVGVACLIRDTLGKIDNSIICNAIVGEFICDKYGIHTERITY